MADAEQLRSELDILQEARRNLNAQLDKLPDDAPGYKALHMQRTLVNARWQVVTSALASAHAAERAAERAAAQERRRLELQAHRRGSDS